MSGATTFTSEISRSAPSRSLAIITSLVLHAFVLATLFFSFRGFMGSRIIAAGPGEGGEGAGGSIEVGVADNSAILGFAKPQPVSFVGDTADSTNNARLEPKHPNNDSSEALLPPTEKDTPDPKATRTDRPVINQQERIFTGKEERGRSATQTAQVGRSFGSATPALIGGIGIGSGGGAGSGTGLPGGSEYGRRIQQILGRNYNPPQIDADSVQYVIILVRIARDGTILSLSGGRVSPAYIRQRSSNAQVNYAAERAVVASEKLPPFPPGFLGNASEATAEVWFRYPK
jgi:TonB-like protein